MDVINGKKVVIPIYIMDEDEYASLDDSDTAYYSLYDVDGDIVSSIEDVSIDIDDDNRHCLNIEIPSSANVISEDEIFSTRILIVNYTLGSKYKEIRKTYRVIPFAPYTCDKDDVRTLLGVASNIIEDDMIDMYGAYLKCKSLFEDDTLLDSKLKTGDLDTNKANRAVALCSALSFRSSLPLLTPKIESDSVVSHTRFTMNMEDFDKLFDDLQAELNDIISDLIDENMEDRYDSTLFVVGKLTDTFTGS